MASYDGFADLRRSGLRRLRDAEELIQPPSLIIAGEPKDRHVQGAVYLSGYGVECFIKVYIVLRTTQTTNLTDARECLLPFHATVPDLSSAAGHNLRMLLRLTDLEAYMTDRQRSAFDLCAKWNANLRYDPRSIRRQDAEDRVRAARVIVDWINSLV